MPKLKPIEAKTQTADEAYQAKKKEILHKVSLIKANLHVHDMKQRKDAGNWGFVGDLGRMNELLGEVLAHVQSTTGHRRTK